MGKGSSEFQTGEDVIRGIQAASSDGVAPATGESKKLYYFAVKFFEEWSVACDRAGVQLRSEANKVKKADVILSLQQLYEAEGKTLNLRENSILYRQAMRLFGGWNNALVAAGFKVNKREVDKAPMKPTEPMKSVRPVATVSKCERCCWRMGSVCPTPSCIKGWEDGNYQLVI